MHFYGGGIQFDGVADVLLRLLRNKVEIMLLCLYCVQKGSSASISDDVDSASYGHEGSRNVTRRRLDFDETSSSLSTSSLSVTDVVQQPEQHPSHHHHHHQQQQQGKALKAEDVKGSSAIYRPWEVRTYHIRTIHQP